MKDLKPYTKQVNYLTWKEIKTFILSEKWNQVHKMIWDDYAVISDWKANRYQIRESDKWTEGSLECILQAALNGNIPKHFYEEYYIY